MRRRFGAILAALLLPGVAFAATPKKVLSVPDPGTPLATTNQIVSQRPASPGRAYHVVHKGPGQPDAVAPVRKSFLPELERSADRLP
jgi:hypothetical protein